jgi:cytochrome c oxidase subunit III
MISWRVTGDTARLPTVTFGKRGVLWWGTLGFMVIEGWTLVLTAATYLYLRDAAPRWPPAETPLPGLMISSTNAALMLGSVVPMWWTGRAARRLDPLRLRLGLVACSLLGISFVLLRWLEFFSLNTSWQSSGYGSAVWATLTLHGSLIVIEVAEVIGATVIACRRRIPVSFYPDVADIAMYWYFLVLSWVPLYAMIYLFPRFK